MCAHITDHCSVQERGDVEDLVQTHGRIDAFVLFASTKKNNTHTHTKKNIMRMKTAGGNKRKRKVSLD